MKTITITISDELYDVLEEFLDDEYISLWDLVEVFDRRREKYKQHPPHEVRNHD